MTVAGERWHPLPHTDTDKALQCLLGDLVR